MYSFSVVYDIPEEIELDNLPLLDKRGLRLLNIIYFAAFMLNE